MVNKPPKITNLKLLYWNANGIVKSKIELLHFLAQHHIDVAFLCETHLKATDVLSVPHFRVHRSDRADGYGGTLILIKNSIPHTRIPGKNLRSLEETTIAVHTADGDLYLSSVYKPPRKRLRPADISGLTGNGGRPTLAAGDFNAKHTAWNSRVCSPAGLVLHSYVHNSNTLKVIGPTEPTRIDPTRHRCDDVLDIMLVNNWTGIMPDPIVHNELPSDHLPVTADVDTNFSHLDAYKHTNNYDWKKFKAYMTDIHSTPTTPHTTEQIDQQAAKLTEDIKNSLHRSQKPTPHTPKIQSLPNDVKNLITTRNRQRRKYQQTRHPTDKYLLNKLNETIRYLIREHRRDVWDKLVQDAQENNIWKLPRMLNKKRAPIPALDNSVPPKSNAETLADTYENQFTSALKPKSHIKLGMDAAINTVAASPDEEITIAEKEVRDCIKRLRNKAPGPDNIPNFAIKNLPDNTINHILNIYNSALALNHFPSPWKTAKIVPVPKPKKPKTSPSSYRPISLLNTLSKILENLILKRMLEHIDEHDLLNPDQFGFTAGHSTVQQLVRVADVISSNTQRKYITGMVSLDLSKAFDSVWHDAFPLKLLQLKFPTKIIKFISSYLSQRYFYVSSNGQNSSLRPIRAGVPQGSALGPVLFILYINNIPTPQDHRVINSIYADDTAILATSKSPQITNQLLETQTENITKYYQTWGLKINPDKTEAVMFTTRRINRPTFKILNQNIEYKNELKYLGVTLDKRLTFRSHISQAIGKATGRIKNMYPLLKDANLLPKTKILLYKSYIRPILTYAAPVWMIAAPTTKKTLEAVQRRAIRIMAGVPRYVSLNSLDDCYNVEPLLEHSAHLCRRLKDALECHPNKKLHNILTIKDNKKPKKKCTITQLLTTI